MPPGIMFLMYRLDRLVVLVYIRQPMRHRGGAKRKDRRMEDGGTATVLYERIVRGVGRLHTPALPGLATPQVRFLRQSLGLTAPGLRPR
jgi:hypothetical protein